MADVKWRVIKPKVSYRSMLPTARAAMRQWGYELRTEVREYPPPPLASNYVRTNQLYNAWRVSDQHIPGGFVVWLFNFARNPYSPNTPYMQFVVGRFQRWFHLMQGWTNLGVHVPASTATLKLRRTLGDIFSRSLRIYS